MKSPWIDRRKHAPCLFPHTSPCAAKIMLEDYRDRPRRSTVQAPVPLKTTLPVPQKTQTLPPKAGIVSFHRDHLYRTRLDWAGQNKKTERAVCRRSLQVGENVTKRRGKTMGGWNGSTGEACASPVPQTTVCQESWRKTVQKSGKDLATHSGLLMMTPGMRSPATAKLIAIR